MLNISYSINPQLSESLNAIEAYRRHILITPLPPKVERKLKWEAHVERLSCIQSQEGNRLHRAHIRELISGGKRVKDTATGQLILNYKNIYELIHEEWFLNPKPINFKTMRDLSASLSAKLRRPPVNYIPQTTAMELLQYLGAQKDQPIVNAAIAYSQWALFSPYPTLSAEALLLAYLFLFKAGFDLRGMISLEAVLDKNPREHKATLDTIKEKGTSTPWIEFFIRTLETHAEAVSAKIDEAVQRPEEDEIAFFDLTDRQRQILSMLDSPDSNMTNRKVQKTFRVSQITASRELSKLASLGLLFPRGKGRSLHYTKI